MGKYKGCQWWEHGHHFMNCRYCREKNQLYCMQFFEMKKQTKGGYY